MLNNLLKKYDLRKFPYRINWEITYSCSFRCTYCVNRQVNKSFKPVEITPVEIARRFDETERQWLILITGGEPFEYSGFVEVCSALSQKHHLQITSNLSSPDVIRFAETVDPDKIFLISASFHTLQREKQNLINDFALKSQYLINKGFPLLVNYLAHPGCFERMSSDIATIKQWGVDVFVIPMRGYYEGLNYPEAYTQEQWDIMKPYLLDVETEIAVAFSKLNLYGRKCEAGSNYFFMNPLGDISRCATLQKKLGNLFEANFSVGRRNRPCIANNCNDVYCGLAAITDKKADKLSVYCEERGYAKHK